MAAHATSPGAGAPPLGEPLPLEPIEGAEGGPTSEVDLPPDLLHQGWRKFWSKRESRPYYFNRLTGDTMWDLPGPTHEAGKLEAGPSGQSEPGFPRNSDPLGINHATAGPHPPPPFQALYPGTSGESERAIASRLLEPKSTVHDIISRFKKTNSIEDKPRRPRARPVRTRQLIEKVRKKLKRSAHRSLAEMSKEYNVSRTSL
eukprot:maker-scaffold577_size191314-snap-gene-0.35 protein:Tk12277 transcript:maker-scaffold577_size191314-snap-gene-0.35-mRNA-1 annotation:"phosphorylated ctd-interacting factor 1"